VGFNGSEATIEDLEGVEDEVMDELEEHKNRYEIL